MQEEKDQMQRTDAMPTLRQPQPRLRVCAQLLRCQFQRIGRIQENVAADWQLARTSRDTLRQLE